MRLKYLIKSDFPRSDVGDQDKSGLVMLNVSFVARDPDRTSLVAD
jgi:hypothetical protein